MRPAYFGDTYPLEVGARREHRGLVPGVSDDLQADRERPGVQADRNAHRGQPRQVAQEVEAAHRIDGRRVDEAPRELHVGHARRCRHRRRQCENVDVAHDGRHLAA